jgi:hypothetical protein
MLKLLLFIFLSLNALASIGNIMALKGSADVHRNSNEMLHAQPGMTIEKGDKIVTQSKTRVQIILKDDTIITIGSNSSFQFDKFFFDGTKKSTLSMHMNRGFFRSVTGKIGKIAPERFKVKTSSATIGIRGTDFSVRLQNTIERFRCYSGGIRITFGNTTRDINAGESFELNLHNIKAWAEQANLNMKHNTFQNLNLEDLNTIETAAKKIDYPRPEPIIPDGTPCKVK